MTVFFPDISGFQAGIDLKGALAAAVKITEGTTFVNPDARRALANAKSHGTFTFGYHFLHHGNATAQAQWYFRNAGRLPCAVDVEAEAGLPDPGLPDLTEFTDALRKAGGVVHLAYLPHWYWQGHLGSPDLAPIRHRNLYLWSSDYSHPYTDSSTGVGWQPYGGSSPAVWQYTDRLRFNGHSVDFSAYRGRFAGKQDAASVAACLADFRGIVETGHLHDDPATPVAANPVGGLVVTRRGFTSVTLAWHADANATSYTVRAYRAKTGELEAELGTRTAGVRVGRLPRGRTLEFHVRAHPGGSAGHAATIKATTR